MSSHFWKRTLTAMGMARNASSGGIVLHVRPDVCGQHVGSLFDCSYSPLMLPAIAMKCRLWE